jgi:hypothetical protein
MLDSRNPLQVDLEKKFSTYIGTGVTERQEQAIIAVMVTTT